MEEQWLGVLSEIFGSTTEASDGMMDNKHNLISRQISFGSANGGQ
jgi:hypothetical protein